DNDVELPFTFPELRRRLAAERGLDDVFDVGDVQAVPRGALPIDLDLQLRHQPGAIDERPRDAADRRDRPQHLVRGPAEDVAVFAEHLDDDLAVDLRDALEDVVANRLREARLDPGDRL